ncbi:MAG: hypothetical protein M0P66_18675 [Salinivirgaceae bacterium]|nr:hypothetical protein [Salinivirgaceae bacterium]
MKNLKKNTQEEFDDKSDEQFEKRLTIQRKLLENLFEQTVNNIHQEKKNIKTDNK